MKIGIITFHNASNYGACLQCQASVEAISKINANTEIIDYTNRFRRNLYNPYFKLIESKSILQFAFNLIALPGMIVRNRAFKSYRIKHIKISRQKSNPQTISNNSIDYDILVAGSDQIWNQVNNGNDENYLLAFAKPHQKKISFSSSFTSNDLNQKTISRFIGLLNNFDFLSTREQKNFNHLRQSIKKEIVETLDPVLLLEKEYWEQFISPVKIDNKFSVLYINNPSFFNDLPKESKIVSIGSFRIKDFFDKKKSIRNNYGPGEFLYLMKNAETVYTTSFHAVVLCLIFNTPFYVHLTGNKGRDSRISTLLALFNLEEQAILKEDQINYQKVIDFTLFNQKISSLRDNTWEYLNKSLI